jgi:hypothetical protein
MAKSGYVIRAKQGTYDNQMYFHVYHRDGGKSINNFTTREDAENYRVYLDSRDAQNADAAARHEAERVAEEERRAALTPEERQREDDERDFTSTKYILKHSQERFESYVEDIARGFDYSAQEIRKALEGYKTRSKRFGEPQVESLMREVADTMFFLTQRTRDKYAVTSSYEVLALLNIVKNLAAKLGVPYPPEQKEGE